MRRKWLRIAHRGASGTTPEHTRPAFEKALAVGVDMIELDVQLSRDGELVVIHDLELERTTDGSGRVSARSYAELRTLDAGGWWGAPFAGARILCLDEVFALVSGRAALNVEVKAPREDWAAAAPRLLDTLRRWDAAGVTVVSCFEPAFLAVLRGLSPAVRVGVLWSRPDLRPAWEWVRRLGAWSIHPHWGLVSDALVRDAHAQGCRVLAWTVNEVADMCRLLDAGADGIMSDYPERFAGLDGDGSGSGLAP